MTDAARVQAFFDTAPEKLATMLQGAIPPGAVITFELSGDGGGTWTVTRKQGTVEVVRAAVDPVDCKLQCSVADFDRLLHGALDARGAFMDGRLLVEGDVGLVQRLNKAFRTNRR